MTAKKVYIGVPRSGKTTRAKTESRAPLHSDDFYHAGLSKSEQSQAAREALDKHPVVAEGIMMLYGMRRWLKDNPRGKPAEEVVFFNTPKVPLSEGQQRMADQVRKVWEEVAPQLRERGVKTETTD